MKKKVLITAYAVNPYNGSEDGTGWNIIRHLALHCDVVAITRRNNQKDIERYLAENPLPIGESLQFHYYDLPRWAIFLKQGARHALLYHYFWQLGVAFFVLGKKWQFELAHHLNFHSDWTPSFLWLLRKPYFWGPVGHHPKTPSAFVLPYGKKAWFSDRLRWCTKCVFWRLDPFLVITKRTAAKVIGVNSSVGKVLRLPSEKVMNLPAVATEQPDNTPRIAAEKFRVLSIGRFVPLKGFDVTVRAFAQFYQKQDNTTQSRLELVLIGKGPEQGRLESIANSYGLPETAIRFVDWVPRNELPQFFASSKVFLFPSHEGAGMVVPEALSYGVPVLCIDNVGPGENIDETCGVKVPYSLGYDGVISALAQAMDTLLHDEAWLAKLSAGALRYFEDHFTWEKKAARIAAVYDRVYLAAQISQQPETDETPSYGWAATSK